MPFLQSVLPPDAHILIVGCGTGYELDYLLKRHPNWQFTAVDPSLTMLQKAQEQVEILGNLPKSLLFTVKLQLYLSRVALMLHFLFSWLILLQMT